MNMNIINRLVITSYGMHIANQTAIVAVPIVTALIFDASPEVIGILVAAQSIAYLLGSIPFGLVVDRVPLKSAALLSTAISFLAFLGVVLSLHFENLIAFGITTLLSSFGIVLFTLVALSVVQMAVKATKLSKANARLEIPRAIASFMIPLGIGMVANQDFSKLIFGLAVVASLIAFVVLLRLPNLPSPPRLKENSLRLILEAGRYTFQHSLLRPIAACAIFWNVAFSALLVVLIPFLADYFGASPNLFGIALAIFGAAAVVGSWLIGRFATRFSTNLFLLFGPGSSALAVIPLLFPQLFGANAVYVVFFFLGFGPSMWLVVQNSIRQLATPKRMLGRVNSVIQTTIYGVRPLGAVIGGGLAGSMSPYAGMVFVVVMFGCSFAASLFSPLSHISSLEDVDSIRNWANDRVSALGSPKSSLS